MSDPIRTVLWRGLSKRCPNCGAAPIFAGWGRHLPRCSHCGLIYEKNSGDTWLFTIVGDRLPIMLLVGAIYFGVGRRHPTAGWLVFGLASIGVIWSSPNR